MPLRAYIKYLKILLLLIFSFLFCISCQKKQEEIKIGFSAPNIDAGWSELLYQEMEQELQLYIDDNIRLITKCSGNDVQKQRQDILDLFDQDEVDVLIVYSFDNEVVVPVLEEVYDKGLPIITLDRKIDTDKYTCRIGFSNYDFGQQVARYANNQLKDTIQVIEILGEAGMLATVYRSQGFRDVVNSNPRFKIIDQFYGGWVDGVVKYKLDSILSSGKHPDLIFAHNDIMAYAAKQVCERYSINPFIIGIDGLAYPGGGLEMVYNSGIDATFYNRPGGDLCINTAVRIIKGEEVEKDVLMKTFPIDKNNVEGLRYGFKFIKQQREKFSNLYGKVSSLQERIFYQRLTTYLILVLALIVAVFAGIAFYFLKQKQRYIKVIHDKNEDIENKIEEEKALSEDLARANKELRRKQDEVGRQNKALIKYHENLEVTVRERTRELSVALEKANESDKLKESFIQNLSHELRTPINAIMGFSPFLFNSEFTEEERRGFQKLIENASEELLHIMENILEISLISSDQYKITTSNFNVLQFINSFYKHVMQKYGTLLNNGKKNIEVILNPCPNAYVETDKAKIQQVLEQLLDNAIKFTEKGKVEVGVERMAGKDTLLFYVMDTGIGIDRVYFDIIFERFRKIEDDQRILHRGNGLGLAICKNVIKKLGGDIWLESERGLGSIFYFTINVGQISLDQDVDLNGNGKSSLSGCQVLVAEDEAYNYLFLKAVLSKQGVHTIWAKDGREAVQKCLEHKNFDLVLMDIEMPHLDGESAFKKIRMMKPTLPVIALTAFNHEKDKAYFLNLGFNDYLSKPVKSATLIDSIISTLVTQ